MSCRSAPTPRFYFLQQIIVEDATPKTPRVTFRVCPWCDVEQSAR